MALCIGLSYAGTSTDFILYADSVGIQVGYGFTGATEYVLLEATSNMMNSSLTTLQMSNAGNGYFKFLSNETFDLQLTFSNMKVSLSGDQGQANRQITNKTVYPVNAGNTIVVSWVIILQPWVPYLFILGMIGLGSMFGGSLYSIHLFKKREYQWALVQAVTFIAVGFGLFISWVFA